MTNYYHLNLLLITIQLCGMDLFYQPTIESSKDIKLRYTIDHHYNDPSRELFNLVVRQQLTRTACKALVRRGAKINAKLYHRLDLKETPLHRAVKNNDYITSCILISCGADVNAIAECHRIIPLISVTDIWVSYTIHNYDTISPLLLATKAGNLKIVKLLIRHGAEINVQDNYGSTPLMVATENGDLSIVKLLIDTGAEINVSYHGTQPAGHLHWSSALHRAVYKNHYKIAQLLIEHGATHGTAMHELIMNIYNHGQRYKDMANLLLEHTIDLLAKSDTQETVFDLLLHHIAHTNALLDPTIYRMYELIMQWCLLQVYDRYLVPLRSTSLGRRLPRDVIKNHIFGYLIGSSKAAQFKPSMPYHENPPFYNKKLLALKKPTRPFFQHSIFATALAIMANLWLTSYSSKNSE